jgi:hypothetical protein
VGFYNNDHANDNGMTKPMMVTMVDDDDDDDNNDDSGGGGDDKTPCSLRNYRLLKQGSVHWRWSLCASPRSCGYAEEHKVDPKLTGCQYLGCFLRHCRELPAP